MLYNIIHNW